MLQINQCNGEQNMTLRQIKLVNKAIKISMAGVDFAQKYSKCEPIEIEKLVHEWFETVDKILGVKKLKLEIEERKL